jgi:hypothetical protein
VGTRKKGLKPLYFLIQIVDHVLKDVAIAPTFRSGQKYPKAFRGFSPISLKKTAQLEKDR